MAIRITVPEGERVELATLTGDSLTVGATNGSLWTDEPAPPVPAPAPVPTSPALPFAIAAPARPNISRTVRVTTDGDAALAASQAGTRIEVAANLSRVAVRASDVEIVAGGYRCGMLTIARALDRVAVRGGTWTGVDVAPAADWATGTAVWRAEWAVEDLTLDGLTIDAAGYAIKIISGRRIAIRNVTARAGQYSVWAEGGGPLQLEDMAIDGCRFDAAGPESTVRLTSVLRAAVVRSRLSNPVKHNLRVHGRSGDVYAAELVLAGGGLMLGAGMAGDSLAAAWFERSAIHSTTDDLASNLGGERLTIRDNVVYRADGRVLVAAARAGWTVSGNVTRPYIAPPA